MAPRTKEQQIAYNAKRRAENAAKKALTYDKGKASVAKAVKATKDMAKSANGKAGAAVRKATKGMPKTVAQKLKGKRKTANVGVAHVPPPKHNIDRQVKTLGADSLLPETKQNARVVNPTMPSAYVRNGKPGAGMLRGKNYQATVTFTPEQFMELKDRAAFWNRSLAEQIRWCVVTQMKA